MNNEDLKVRLEEIIDDFEYEFDNIHYKISHGHDGAINCYTVVKLLRSIKRLHKEIKAITGDKEDD